MTRSKHLDCCETISFYKTKSKGKTKINTHSQRVKQNSVHEVTETLGSIIFMTVSISILATARQQAKCSSRHQSSAENSPMVAHCPENNFCF